MKVKKSTDSYKIDKPSKSEKKFKVFKEEKIKFKPKIVSNVINFFENIDESCTHQTKPSKSEKKIKVLKEEHIKFKPKIVSNDMNFFENIDESCTPQIKPDIREYPEQKVAESKNTSTEKSIVNKKCEPKKGLLGSHFSLSKRINKLKSLKRSSKVASIEFENEMKILDTEKAHKISKNVNKIFSAFNYVNDPEDNQNLESITKTIKRVLRKSDRIQELKESFIEPSSESVQENHNTSSENGMEISEENNQFETYSNLLPIPKKAFKLFTSDRKSLLIIDESSAIHFHGLMEIKVLFGTISILGKSLNIHSPFTKVYSPRGSAFLSLKNENISENLDTNKLLEDIHQYGFLSATAHEFINCIESTGAVILCKKLIDRKMEFITNNISQVIFPYCEDTDLQCEFWDYNDQNRRVFNESEDWQKLVDVINTTSKVFLCGGKNVGKSTMLRYLVNKLLNKFEEVLVIDLDPGQSEFTVPGCISAVKIRMPIIGPNYTHILKPDRCIFVPNYDIGSTYKMYLKCVKELLSVCDFNNIPTLVNYIGFTNGIGAHLTASVICEVQPTTIVQIESHIRRKNYDEDLNIHNIDKLKRLLTSTFKTPKFSLIKINSMSQHNQWELEPRQTREMSILAYLAGALSSGSQYLTEPETNVYRCNISNIKLICDGKPCDPASVNAKLVAFCTEKSNNNNTPIYRCHGWGIVRGISKELDTLAVITPLPYDELEKIDHLIAGCVNLPPSIYLQTHKRVVGLVPYVYKGDLNNYAKCPKRNG